MASQPSAPGGVSMSYGLRNVDPVCSHSAPVRRLTLSGA